MLGKGMPNAQTDVSDSDQILEQSVDIDAII